MLKTFNIKNPENPIEIIESTNTNDENINIIGVDAFGSVIKKYHETREFDEKEIYPYVTEGIGEDILPKNVNFDIIDYFEKVGDKEAAVATRRLAKEEGLLLTNPNIVKNQQTEETYLFVDLVPPKVLAENIRGKVNMEDIFYVKFDRVKSNIIAIVCSDPPEGFDRWTLELLQEKSVKEKIVDNISLESVRVILEEHDIQPWRQKSWCVPDLDEEFIERMEDVLKVKSKKDIPELNIYQCGTYKMHSLTNAKKIASDILSHKIGVMNNKKLTLSKKKLKEINK